MQLPWRESSSSDRAVVRGPHVADPAQSESQDPNLVTGAMTRLRMTVGYDGSAFKGFARQPEQRTVAGELARAISNVCRHDVDIVCAGRTDSGVHAEGQVIHFEAAAGIDPQSLKRSINRQLSPEIVVRSADVAADGFDARRSAKARSYRYLVLNADEPDPLLANVVWHIPDVLDLRTMRAAADAFLGEHDFSAFCRRPPDHPSGAPITRRVLDSSWTSTRLGGEADNDVLGGELLRFDIRATSFCHQMVRSVVAVLVEVGKGRMKPSDVPRLLASPDRSGAKTPAPPHGLCLMRVDY
jgi:tRNA pseudouridine38-40 synthase